MNKTYTIRDLFILLISRLWLIILASVICAGSAFAYTKFAVPLKYSSHISMYVQSYTDIKSNDLQEQQNNINNSKQLINTYIEVLKDDAVMGAVADALEKDFGDEAVLRDNFSYLDGRIRPSSIVRCINITSVTDTSALNVVATTKNPELSAFICNSLSAVSQEYIEQAVGVGSINTIATAKVYREPVSPNIIKNTILGFAAGFMLICLVIFLIDFFNNTVRMADELAKTAEKPVLGEVKKITGEKSGGNKGTDNIPLLNEKGIPFEVIEGYKSIRANLMFSLGVSESKVIAVSSCNPSEGKSVTAANIAIVMSQTESRVLLIDGDMRKPVIHKRFKLKNKLGLSTVIIGKSELKKAIQKNVSDNLDILTSGAIPPNPSELLASEQFGRILKELSEIYDYIIIDSPPCNIVSDINVMSKNASGVLFVVRYGKTLYSEVRDAMERLKLSDSNVLGFILNDVRRKHDNYYYRNKYKYKYKYKYGYYKYGYAYKSEDDSDNKKSDRKEKDKVKDK